MYRDHFGFREPPFSIAPDPRFLYLSEVHRQGLELLHQGLSAAGSIVLLSGATGTGKTTLCRYFVEQLEPTARVAVIAAPGRGAFELLAAACTGFGIVGSAETQRTDRCLEALRDALVQADGERRGRTPALVIIDEAHNLDGNELDMVGRLADLKSGARPLLTVILLGQEEIHATLTSPDLTRVARQISGRFQLTGLGPADTARYIGQRQSVAGAGRKDLFSAGAMKRLHRLSGGIPRSINRLCERSLIRAREEGKDRVDNAAVRQAARQVLGYDRTRRTVEIPLGGLLISFLTLLVVVLVWAGSTSDLFHIRLNSVLPPPQQEASPGASTGPREEAPVEDRAAARPPEQPPPQPVEVPSPPTLEPGAEETAMSEEAPAIEAESPAAETVTNRSPSTIFIAPVEISARREGEQATRIQIKDIEVAQ